MVPLKCPACLTVTNQRAAHGGPFDWGQSGGETSYTCPSCQRGLRHCLGLIAGQEWFELTEPIAPASSWRPGLAAPRIYSCGQRVARCVQ